MLYGSSFMEAIASISGHSLFRRGNEGGGENTRTAASVIERCGTLLSGRGEASGTAIGAEVLDGYLDLDESGRLDFFQALAGQFGPEPEKLAAAVEAWLADPFKADAGDLHYFSESRRQELFRRLNRAPDGTHAILRMRADLLDLLAEHKHLAPLDRDLVHLLLIWFNPGFLVLRCIDWSTPAIVLEKIIYFEAVHEIRDWDDLRRRLDPVDRRCYGFFHPALIDEPLIFVEVVLTETIPAAIGPLLVEDRPPVPLELARTAVFYSISNCQRGLAGISFGNFLIKRVARELRRELPKLENFVTLSPAQGFVPWLKENEDLALSDEDRKLFGSGSV